MPVFLIYSLTFLAFLGFYREMVEEFLNLSRDHFLPNSFLFTIHRHYLSCETETSLLLNKLRYEQVTVLHLLSSAPDILQNHHVLIVNTSTK
jgi:hypothetical protein